MGQKHKHDEMSAKTPFVCHAAEATKIFLAGTFNNWDPQANLMERTPDGAWRIDLELEPGRYEYKFVVDGQWCCEPAREDAAGCPQCVRDGNEMKCPDCVPNGFGTMNRVIEVSAAGSVKAGAAVRAA